MCLLVFTDLSTKVTWASSLPPKPRMKTWNENCKLLSLQVPGHMLEFTSFKLHHFPEITQVHSTIYMQIFSMYLTGSLGVHLEESSHSSYREHASLSTQLKYITAPREGSSTRPLGFLGAGAT